MPPPPKPAASPTAYTPGSGEPSAPSTRPSRSVSRPPSVLRVKMCNRTAISGPPEPARPAPGDFRSSSSCGGVTRISRSPRNFRAADGRHDLRILAQPGPHLEVAGSMVCCRASASIRCSPASWFIWAASSATEPRGHEVDPAFEKRPHLRRRARARTRPASSRRSLPVRSAFCSDPDRPNSADDRLLIEHEPGVVITRRGDVPQGAERVEAREQRGRKPLAAGVQPQRGRSRQHPDAVVAPDRGVVHDPFRVVPHPVRVDHPAAGLLRSPAASTRRRSPAPRRSTTAAAAPQLGRPVAAGPDRGCRRCRRRPPPPPGRTS